MNLAQKLYDDARCSRLIAPCIYGIAARYGATDPDQIVTMMKPWSKLIIDQEGHGGVFVDLPDLDLETGGHIICQHQLEAAMIRFKELHAHLFNQ